MLKKIGSFYFSIPLIWRILFGFIIGIITGLFVSEYGTGTAASVITVIEPFGTVLISMLKMVVFPIIFFSLILGASALPLKKSGKLGLSVIVWYFATSIFAALFGVAVALLMNPSMAGGKLEVTALSNTAAPAGDGFKTFVNSLFLNPFEALATGHFLPIVVFSILFGLAARVLLDSDSTKPETSKSIGVFLQFCKAAEAMSFKLIEWVMEYFPYGVAALTFVNFARNGGLLFGPYIRIIFCVVMGVCGMIFLIYPLAIFLFCRENPYRILYRLREPMLMGFVTRSSAATLPISYQAAKELGVSPSLSSFSLPLGCTINMDGVCVHLPVFVILAGNIYNVPFTTAGLLILLVSVVFASVGAGGVPGGSIFLLFMVLENAGFTPEQVGCIVALALGINPILDMFETACNLTGDNVCTYIIAKRSGMITVPDESLRRGA